MNGPAYALLTFVFLMGVFMAGSAVLRYRRRPGQWNRPETLLHLGVTALWLAALFVIPIVAEPGDQPRLGAFANAVSLILVFTAIRDLRHGLAKRPR